jgi:hypothetical protein
MQSDLLQQALSWGAIDLSFDYAWERDDAGVVLAIECQPEDWIDHGAALAKLAPDASPYLRGKAPFPCVDGHAWLLDEDHDPPSLSCCLPPQLFDLIPRRPGDSERCRRFETADDAYVGLEFACRAYARK